jgi:UDP:flavonoid glycosyltransferase YjiC (YdhE family)
VSRLFSPKGTLIHPGIFYQSVGCLLYQKLNLRQSGVCIHDGNDYICDICAANAIPQLIVTDHRYGRTANALAARRYGFGIMEDEAHLSVAALYENYRRLVVDQRFREAALAMREEIISLGDSDDLYRLILSLCRK